MPEEIVSLVYRRVATIRNARAMISPLARGWGVVIKGRIGCYSFTVMEHYFTKHPAVFRSRQINKHKVAIVDSIEQVLFPRTFNVGFIPERYFKQVLQQQQRERERAL